MLEWPKEIRDSNYLKTSTQRYLRKKCLNQRENPSAFKVKDLIPLKDNGSNVILAVPTMKRLLTTWTTKLQEFMQIGG
jgi:hypothetical protein